MERSQLETGMFYVFGLDWKQGCILNLAVGVVEQKCHYLAVRKEGSPTGSSQWCIKFNILSSTLIKFVQKCQKFSLRTCGNEGVDLHSPKSPVAVTLFRKRV